MSVGPIKEAAGMPVYGAVRPREPIGGNEDDAGRIGDPIHHCPDRMRAGRWDMAMGIGPSGLGGAEGGRQVLIGGKSE